MENNKIYILYIYINGVTIQGGFLSHQQPYTHSYSNPQIGIVTAVTEMMNWIQKAKQVPKVTEQINHTLYQRQGTLFFNWTALPETLAVITLSSTK